MSVLPGAPLPAHLAAPPAAVVPWFGPPRAAAPPNPIEPAAAGPVQPALAGGVPGNDPGQEATADGIARTDLPDQPVVFLGFGDGSRVAVAEEAADAFAVAVSELTRRVD